MARAKGKAKGKAKGRAKEDARRVAGEIMKDKNGALDTLAREELGIDPAELGHRAIAAARTAVRGSDSTRWATSA